MEYINAHQRIQHRQRVLRDAEEYGVSKAARRHGLTRKTIYEWRQEVVPQKPGPKGRVPWQTSPQLEEQVVIMRKGTNYGPKRLRAELKLQGVSLGEKAIRGILERAELVRKHHKKRERKKQKFYTPYPGYRVQIDTKVVPDEKVDLRSGERYQFSAIDIATKIRFLLIYDELSNFNSIDFLKQTLAFFKDIGIKVECVQTDNHSTFTNLYLGGNKKKDHQLLTIHPFTKYCLKSGIEHLLSRPARPQDNCFVERSHRTDDEEFYHFLDLSTLSNDQLQQKIKDWTFQYNSLRLHSACNYLPPLKSFLLNSV